jgi:hypothetical protein
MRAEHVDEDGRDGDRPCLAGGAVLKAAGLAGGGVVGPVPAGAGGGGGQLGYGLSGLINEYIRAA